MLDLLLRGSPLQPPVRMESLKRASFSEDTLRELHSLANQLMNEEWEHFRIHAFSNDVVHLFRRLDTGEPIGFQFWKTAPFGLPRSRAIIGGKLRILPAFRNRGLHLFSGLTFYLQNRLRKPWLRYYRLSIASLFGFVSITEALAEYHLFDPRKRHGLEGLIHDGFATLARESHFQLDEETGLFFVDIRMTKQTLERYPQRYFDRPAARRYAEANPDYRTNGCYLGFWFTFSPKNLLALVRTLWRKRTAPKPPLTPPAAPTG